MEQIFKVQIVNFVTSHFCPKLPGSPKTWSYVASCPYLTLGVPLEKYNALMPLP